MCQLCVRAKSLQLCLTVCDPMDCNLLGSSVHGILQERILEWVAMPSSRGSSQPRDRTCVSNISWLADKFFSMRATWEVQVKSTSTKMASRPVTVVWIYGIFEKKKIWCLCLLKCVCVCVCVCICVSERVHMCVLLSRTSSQMHCRVITWFIGLKYFYIDETYRASLQNNFFDTK